MAWNSTLRRKLIRCSRGFTVNELLIIIIIVSLLLVTATPALTRWRELLCCREAARMIVSTLRLARSRAIATNREHKVQFESASSKYRILQGDRANESINWETTVQDWASLPPGISLSTNNSAIQLNTNGTSSAATISIQDSGRSTKYQVIVASSGRIRVR